MIQVQVATQPKHMHRVPNLQIVTNELALIDKVCWILAFIYSLISLLKYFLNQSFKSVILHLLFIYLFIQFNSIQVYLYSAFHDANHCKAALQKIKVSTLYLVIAYQW